MITVPVPSYNIFYFGLNMYKLSIQRCFRFWNVSVNAPWTFSTIRSKALLRYDSNVPRRSWPFNVPDRSPFLTVIMTVTMTDPDRSWLFLTVLDCPERFRPFNERFRSFVTYDRFDHIMKFILEVKNITSNKFRLILDEIIYFLRHRPKPVFCHFWDQSQLSPISRGPLCSHFF